VEGPYLLPLRQRLELADAICQQGLNLWLENTFLNHMALEVGRFDRKGQFVGKAGRQQHRWPGEIPMKIFYLLGGTGRWRRLADAFYQGQHNLGKLCNLQLRRV